MALFTSSKCHRLCLKHFCRELKKVMLHIAYPSHGFVHYEIYATLWDLCWQYNIFPSLPSCPTNTCYCMQNIVPSGYCRFRNPYHNNLHAADVAQTCHHLLSQTGLMHWLTDLEIFATLVAALIHDYEHTGTTNNFHVMSGSDTALLYNDRAVLENHHISAAFRVLKDDECNILQNLSRDEYRELRTLIIDMVLATDMSFHFQQLKNMKNLLTLAEPQVDKSKALSLVLHCCDISHPAKRWDIHHKWTMLLLEEFFRQGDLERELGLPFSPLCDRNNTLVAESQIGFIEFIVEPSMAVCTDMLEIILAPIASMISNNNNNNSLSNRAITAEPGTAAGSNDNSENRNTLNIPEESSTDVILEEKNEEKLGLSSDKTRFRIRKPWVTCLAENKKIWKEQAVKGELVLLEHETFFTFTAFSTDSINTKFISSTSIVFWVSDKIFFSHLHPRYK